MKNTFLFLLSISLVACAQPTTPPTDSPEPVPAEVIETEVTTEEAEAPDEMDKKDISKDPVVVAFSIPANLQTLYDTRHEHITKLVDYLNEEEREYKDVVEKLQSISDKTKGLKEGAVSEYFKEEQQLSRDLKEFFEIVLLKEKDSNDERLFAYATVLGQFELDIQSILSDL